MLCPTCGTSNPPDARFCHQCGTRLAGLCPVCGHLNVAEARFCNQCGSRLVEELASGGYPPGGSGDGFNTSPALPLLPLPSPLEPPRGYPPLPDEERRPVTILFADIVGFTALADRLDAEEARELTAIALGRLAREVTSLGGTIDKFIGDAVLALFGAPVAHEDDAQRAVGAGLAMLRACDELNETLALPPGVRLAIRVGINTGQVVVGGREVGGHREYTAIGDAVNVASRLQAAAEPGTVLVGEGTYRGAARAYAFLPLPPLTLRGKPEPVPAYRALGPIRIAADEDRRAGELGGPLVGREQELASLRYCLDQLLRGRGQIAFVVGEAGLGKTRLVAELRREVGERAVRWSVARGVSYAQHVSHGIFAGAVRDIFSPDGYPDDQQAAAALREFLAEREVSEAYPFLAYQLGLPAEEAAWTELGRLSPQEFLSRLTGAIRSWLGALAREAPLVFVVDDLHWADPSSLALLDGLLDLADEVPVFFCFLLRPERESQAWQLKERAARELPHRYSEVALQPLDESDRRALVAQLVHVPAPLQGLEEQILARTEGNPLFIEEVVRDLVERGALVRTDDGWEAVRTVDALYLPDSLQAAIIARTDRLRESLRHLVQTAAVIGRTFSLPVLARVLGEHPSLEEDLRESQRLDLLREVSAQPEREYSFKHPLVQEAIYNTLLVRRRRELHETVGQVLEALYPDRLDEFYAALARHYAAAERWEQAFHFARLEGDRAAAAHATREALEHYQLAWRAARELPTPLDEPLMIELLEKRGDVQALLGLSDEAVASYQEALPHVERGDDPTRLGRLYVKLARVGMLRQDPVATEEYLEAAFAALPADRPELSLAWSIRSWLEVWRNRHEAAAAAGDRALALAREHGDFACLNEAYYAISHPSLAALPGRDYTALAEDWIAAARERGDQHALLRALSAAALNQLWIAGSAERSTVQMAREAVELAERLGAEAGLRSARALLGSSLLAEGRWDDARAELEAARGAEGEVGPTEEIVALWLGLLETWRGQLDRGRATLAAALDTFGFPHSWIWLNQALALNRLLAGDLAAAREALERGGEAAERLDCLPCRAAFSGDAAELWVALGETERATGYAVQARDLGQRLGRRPTLLAAERAEAAIAAGRGQWPRAIRTLRSALRLAQATTQPFEIARTELQLGHALARSHRPADRERALEHLRTALDLFRELGVDPTVVEVLAPSVRAASEWATA